jgi:hypothetical protein
MLVGPALAQTMSADQYRAEALKLAERSGYMVTYNLHVALVRASHKLSLAQARRPRRSCSTISTMSD